MGKKYQNSKNEKFETFLLKLNEILNNNSYANFINWSENGKYIIIKDLNELSKKVLPKYFKHHNYSSFVRQLNMYNFHKVKTNLNSNEQIFQHNKFIKGISVDKIKRIKRKIHDNESLSSSAKDEKSYSLSGRNNKNNDNKIEDSINYLVNKTNENSKIQDLLQKQIELLTKQNLLLMQSIEKNNQQLIIQNNFNKRIDGISFLIKSLLTNFPENNLKNQNFQNNKFLKYNIINSINNNGININKLKNRNDMESPTLSKKKNIVEKGENFSINSNESTNFPNKINESFNDNLSIESLPSKNFFDLDMSLNKNIQGFNFFTDYPIIINQKKE